MDPQGRHAVQFGSTEFEKPRDHPSEDGKNATGDRNLCPGQGAREAAGLQEVTCTSPKLRSHSRKGEGSIHPG